MESFIQNIAKKPVVFFFELQATSFTTSRILGLLLERGIEVDEFHFHSLALNTGKLVVHCLVEKDRIGYTARLLNKFPGILKLDWMESIRRLL